jgi:hypothetical protein
MAGTDLWPKSFRPVEISPRDRLEHRSPVSWHGLETNTALAGCNGDELPKHRSRGVVRRLLFQSRGRTIYYIDLLSRRLSIIFCRQRQDDFIVDRLGVRVTNTQKRAGA